MDETQIKAGILGHLNDSLEVVRYDSGFLVFVPLKYSDDDAVTLYVCKSSGGWLVTDQGSTILRHHVGNVPTEAPRFVEAWNAVTKPPSFFVPGGAQDGAIETWGAEEGLPAMVIAVAQAALRAEELHWITTGRQRKNFASNVLERTKNVFASLPERDRYTLRERAKIRSRSGRERLVTAAVVQDDTVRLAIQAVGGGSREGREQAYEHCYAIFGNSEIERSSRLAIAIGSSNAWDAGVLTELRSVTDVVFYDDPASIESEVRSRLPRELLSS